MDALSEFEEVKRKIATTEARLERAEADGLPIDNPGVFALRNELIRLYDKEARLQPPTSGQFFDFYSEMHCLHHEVIFSCCCFFCLFLPLLLILVFSPSSESCSYLHRSYFRIFVLGDDSSGESEPHITAIVIGKKTVLACTHSLALASDSSKKGTKRKILFCLC
jgi:hypothetical protein